MLAVCRLSDKQPQLQVGNFVDSSTQKWADSKAEMLHGTNLLQSINLYKTLY